MKYFINPQEIQDAISGIGTIFNSQFIKEQKEKYGQERIDFWQFRQFAEMCDYILENDIENENFLSKDAKDRFVSYFLDFIEKHPL